MKELASLALVALLAGAVPVQARSPQNTSPRRARNTQAPSSRPAHPTRNGESGARGDQERPSGRRRGRAGRARQDAKPRPGIPVTEPLIFKHCTVCHKATKDKLVGRISYMRKSPEGWELSMKRMLRQRHLKVSAQDARQIIRYLSSAHGLTRKEAERGLYEAERRVHWSEKDKDEDLRKTCAACHTLGRVLSQQRDAREWKLLKATHLAFFPLANFQAFRGSRRNRDRGSRSFQNMTPAEARAAFRRRREQPKGPDRADRVLAALAKNQPLFSADWKEWQVERREVPVVGSWTVIGHEVSRGDVRGSMEIRSTGRGAFETTWNLEYGDGRSVQRKGKGLLYAGYSWRGRSRPFAGTPDSEPSSLREVLLLSEDWNTFRGRLFTGGYNELGMDVTLHRNDGNTRILVVDHGALLIPSTGQVLDVLGTSFPAQVDAGDFSLGQGVSVSSAQRLDAGHVRLLVDVARDAQIGQRRISWRAVRGPDSIVLYDTIDYIKINPEQGLARIGGKPHPKQLERFEAWAWNRGKDQKSYTKDDFKIRLVKAHWHLEEFPVHEDDDDAQFVGTLAAASGVFTPAMEGPNPKRKWSANNIGDVYVVATCTLMVPKTPAKKQVAPPPSTVAPAPEQGGSGAVSPRPGPGSGSRHPGPSLSKTLPEGGAASSSPETARPPLVMVKKDFKARGHLLVTVPLYVLWDRMVWDEQ